MWMKDKNIDVLGVQETRFNTSHKESSKYYTRFFASNPKTSKTFGDNAGVGFFVKKQWIKYIKDIEVVNDRIQVLTLNASPPFAFINAYAPPADRQNCTKVEVQFRENIVLRSLRNDFCGRASQARKPAVRAPDKKLRGPFLGSRGSSTESVGVGSVMTQSSRHRFVMSKPKLLTLLP